MNWIDAAGWALASACFSLALIHVGIWVRSRTATANLAFALVAVGAALYDLGEIGMMRAASADRFGIIQRWIHVPIFMMVVGIVWFVAAFFRTGRPWLAHTAWVVNLVTVVVDFVRGPNADYRAITGLRTVSFLGDQVSVGLGPTSAWHWVGQFSFLAVVCFVADASLSLWRSGRPEARRRAVTVGGSMAVFVVVAAGQAGLMFAGVLQGPELGAPWFFPVVAIMAWELSNEVVRAARLTGQLQATEVLLRQSEARMRRAAMTAQQLSGRLIAAQEDERRRIARELHDGVSQRVAVMALDLESLRRAPVGDDAQERFERLMSEVRELSSDLHNMSHQLHPAKLDQLGLAVTARAWCRDLASQSGLAIEFACEDGIDLRGDEAVCLYRILQEATRNIIRHSGAATARVILREEDDAVHLVVEDTGRGFEPEVAGRNGGLGLVSMKERVRSLKGSLTIESAEGHGTRLEAVVPLRRPSRRARPRAGGRVSHAAN